MKISIIVSAYNIEGYIGKCLDSLINQTYQNIEIIVINDGSTDNTKNIILKYAEADNRIISITQKNQGVQCARKNGLDISTGEYFLMVDGDDYLEQCCIEKLVDSTRIKSYDIVYFNYNIIKNGSINPIIAELDYINQKNNKFLFDFITTNMPNGLCLKLIRRQFINDNKINFIIKKYNFGEDLLGTIILGLYNPKVFYISECLYNYVQRETSAVNSLNDNVLQVMSIFDFIERNYINTVIFSEYYEEYKFFKYSQTYFTYCIIGKKNKYRRIFYEYWNENSESIFENRIYKIKYNYFTGKIKEKIFYYNINFELGELMSDTVLDIAENNNKRLQIINNDSTTNTLERYCKYNNLYEKIFGLANNDILKEYILKNQLTRIILYGNSTLAIHLKKLIENYENIEEIYIADSYISKNDIINIQNNNDIFKRCDKIIILPIHAYERIENYILKQGISKEKIISIEDVFGIS